MVILPGCVCCVQPPCDELYSAFKAAQSVEIDVTAEDHVRHTRGTMTVNQRCGIPVGGTFGITSWFPGSAYAGRLSLARGPDTIATSSSGTFRELNFRYIYPQSSVGVCSNLDLYQSPVGYEPLVWLQLVAPEPVSNTDKTLIRLSLLMSVTGLYRCDRTGENYLQSLSGCEGFVPSCPGGIRRDNYVALMGQVDFACNEQTGLPPITTSFTVGDVTQCNLGPAGSDGLPGVPVYSNVFSSGSTAVTLSNLEIVA